MYLLALAVSRGPAAPIDVALTWEAPPGCPQQPELLLDLDAMVAGSRQRGDVAFEGRVERVDEAFNLELSTRWVDGREEQRRLSAASCNELTDAAVLLMAITLDPVATSKRVRASGWSRQSEPAVQAPTRREPPPEPAPVPKAKPSPAPPEQKPAPPATRGDDEVRYGIRGSFVVDWGSLPKLAPGFGLDLSVEWKLLRAEVVGGYWFRQRATRQDLEKEGAWVEVGALGPRLCVSPVAGTVEFPVCAGVEFGAMRARGIGPALGTPEYTFWSAANGGPTLVWSVIPTLAITIGLDIVIPFTRTRVLASRRAELHRPEPVILRPGVGLEVRL
jgi:hypothetical protein